MLELPGVDGLVDLEKLLKTIGKRNIVTVMVEGGSKILGSLFDHRLVDKVLIFISPIIIGGSQARTAVGGDGVNSLMEALSLGRVKIKKFGNNVLISGYLKKRAQHKLQSA